jgi:hypothetical protein
LRLGRSRLKFFDVRDLVRVDREDAAPVIPNLNHPALAERRLERVIPGGCVNIHDEHVTPEKLDSDAHLGSSLRASVPSRHGSIIGFSGLELDRRGFLSTTQQLMSLGAGRRIRPGIRLARLRVCVGRRLIARPAFAEP